LTLCLDKRMINLFIIQTAWDKDKTIKFDLDENDGAIKISKAYLI